MQIDLYNAEQQSKPIASCSIALKQLEDELVHDMDDYDTSNPHIRITIQVQHVHSLKGRQIRAESTIVQDEHLAQFSKV